MPTILVNGLPSDSIAATDRGLHYGDGLFETLAVRDRVPELWDAHLARLAEGCRRLGIPFPDSVQLASELAEVCPEFGRAVGKILLTRGPGGRGYRPASDREPTRIVVASQWPDYPSEWQIEGVRVRLCHTRLGVSPALSGIKHLGRLEQVMARSEWSDPEIAEGLLENAEGDLVEGIMTNLFVVVGRRLVTPPVDRSGVAGVMRATVMRIAHELGINAEERQLVRDQLRAADEIFLTNSLIRIWPVRQIDQMALQVGPVTRMLQQALRQQLGG